MAPVTMWEPGTVDDEGGAPTDDPGVMTDGARRSRAGTMVRAFGVVALIVAIPTSCLGGLGYLWIRDLPDFPKSLLAGSVQIVGCRPGLESVDMELAVHNEFNREVDYVLEVRVRDAESGRQLARGTERTRLGPGDRSVVITSLPVAVESGSGVDCTVDVAENCLLTCGPLEGSDDF